MLKKVKKEEIIKTQKEAIISYEALLKESEKMKDNMQQLLHKYKQSLKLIAMLQSKNIELQKEVSKHQVREAALLGHIKSNVISMMFQNVHEQIDERMIN